jgi:hypothetical protein
MYPVETKISGDVPAGKVGKEDNQLKVFKTSGFEILFLMKYQKISSNSCRQVTLFPETITLVSVRLILKYLNLDLPF